MSTSIPARLTATCPHCGVKAQAHARHAGRPTRCRKCGRAFRIPLVEDAPESQPEARRRRVKKKPEPTVGFGCRVCGARMTVGVKHVGRRAKCPDCGVATVVPEPEAPRKPDIPKALAGEQYEVYDGEDQPHAADLIARQPRQLPVECHHCQTLMHARPDQLGERLTCPDCGLETKVTVLDVEAPREVLVEGYEVSAPEASGDAVKEVARAYMERAEAEVAANTAIEAFAPRPELPRWPLLTGVFAFVKTEGAVARWIVLSLFLFVWVAAMAFGMATLGLTPGGKIQAFGVAILGVCAAVFGLFVLMIWTGAIAAHLLEIFVESSEGNDRIHEWPTTNPTDWFGEAGYLLVGLAAAAAPGGLLAAFAARFATDLPAAPLIGLAGAALSLVLLYPVVLLSQLSASSPFAVFVPAVGRAVFVTGGAWLLFWIESLLLGVLAAAAVAGVAWAPLAVVAAAPLLVAAAAVYFRLLGRLAWVVAERTSVVAEDEPGDA